MMLHLPVPTLPQMLFTTKEAHSVEEGKKKQNHRDAKLKKYLLRF